MNTTSTLPQQSERSGAAAHAFACVIIGVILLAALLLAGGAAAAPSYGPSTVGMENVVIYNDAYRVSQGTPYITVPFNITLSANEIARGFFIREDSRNSTPSLLSGITEVRLAVDGWNDVRGSDNKIAAASSDSQQFEGASVRVFVVNLSTAALAPGSYTLAFCVDTAWSGVAVGDSAVADWKNAECIAVFPFTVEGSRTIHYEGNGATAGSMADQTVAFNGTVTLSPVNFSRSGYDFNQWNTRADGTGYLYYDGASYLIRDDLTLYAQWVEAGKSSISGTITNASGYDDITLVLNGTSGLSYAGTVPAASSSYRINDVIRGAYNLNAEYTNGTFTYSLMYLVDVVSNQPTVCNIVFPDRKIKASVDISTRGDTPSVLVGGLNEEVISQTGSLDPGKTAELVFSAEAHPAAEIPEDSAKIRQKIQDTHPEAESGDVLYLNSTVSLITRYENGTLVSSEQITETDHVLEVCIPYDFTGKSAVYVYRLHDGTAELLTGLQTRPTAPYEDGTYFLDTENGVVRVYADKYSIYSIVYTPTYSPGSSSSHSMGYTIILPGNSTSIPTAAPTAEPTAVPTEDIPTQTTTPLSPAPVVGLLAGLGAAAVLLRLRK